MSTEDMPSLVETNVVATMKKLNTKYGELIEMFLNVSMTEQPYEESSASSMDDEEVLLDDEFDSHLHSMRAQTLMKKNNWFLFSVIFFCIIQISESKSETSRYEILSGNNISNTKEEWDQKFLSRGYIFGKAPAQFLKDNANLLKSRSTVLDLGMGEGEMPFSCGERPQGRWNRHFKCCR